MSNKDLILQEILSYEAITRISKLLDQLAEGLQTLGVLKIMRLFPQNFVDLFTYKPISGAEVAECLCISPNLQDPGDAVTIKHLRRFIRESSDEGNLCILYARD